MLSLGKENISQLFSQLDMIMYLGILLSRKMHCACVESGAYHQVSQKLPS